MLSELVNYKRISKISSEGDNASYKSFLTALKVLVGCLVASVLLLIFTVFYSAISTYVKSLLSDKQIQFVRDVVARVCRLPAVSVMFKELVFFAFLLSFFSFVAVSVLFIVFIVIFFEVMSRIFSPNTSFTQGEFFISRKLYIIFDAFLK
ncbi:MAG: hypothetical protein RR086_03400 [Clostridia bacterium]